MWTSENLKSQSVATEAILPVVLLDSETVDTQNHALQTLDVLPKVYLSHPMKLSKLKQT